MVSLIIECEYPKWVSASGGIGDSFRSSISGFVWEKPANEAGEARLVIL